MIVTAATAGLVTLMLRVLRRDPDAAEVTALRAADSGTGEVSAISVRRISIAGQSDGARPDSTQRPTAVRHPSDPAWATSRAGNCAT